MVLLAFDRVGRQLFLPLLALTKGKKRNSTITKIVGDHLIRLNNFRSVRKVGVLELHLSFDTSTIETEQWDVRMNEVVDQVLGVLVDGGSDRSSKVVVQLNVFGCVVLFLGRVVDDEDLSRPEQWVRCQVV